MSDIETKVVEKKRPGRPKKIKPIADPNADPAIEQEKPKRGRKKKVLMSPAEIENVEKEINNIKNNKLKELVNMFESFIKPHVY